MFKMQSSTRLSNLSTKRVSNNLSVYFFCESTVVKWHFALAQQNPLRKLNKTDWCSKSVYWRYNLQHCAWPHIWRSNHKHFGGVRKWVKYQKIPIHDIRAKMSKINGTWYQICDKHWNLVDGKIIFIIYISLETEERRFESAVLATVEL